MARSVSKATEEAKTAEAQVPDEAEATSADAAQAAQEDVTVPEVPAAAVLPPGAAEALAAEIARISAEPPALIPNGTDLTFSDPAAVAEPETRIFIVADPVSMDGDDYAPGDPIEVDETRHAELRMAGVLRDPWDE